MAPAEAHKDDERQREFPFTMEDFRFLARMVGEKTGIVLAEHKRDMVYGRVARRIRALELKSVRQYCDLLAGPDADGELLNFVNAVTTNLTRFFREEHHFEHLAATTLAEIKAAKQARLRLWSAGCSAGMEAYSMAMTVHAAVPDIAAWDCKILASDIDTNMLDTGHAGVYLEGDVKEVPSAYRKYIEDHPSDGAKRRVRIADALRRMVHFKRLNLLEPWPVKGPFDAIFCRNVVIYFNKDTQRVLFDRFANLLKPQGWLYIGHSENLHGVSDRFELKGRTIYRRVR